MRLEYDLDVGALYIALIDSPVARTVEYGDNANVDLDATGSLVGIEVISAAHRWPLISILSQFTIDKTDAAQLVKYFMSQVPVSGPQLVADVLPVMMAEPTAPASVPVPA